MLYNELLFLFRQQEEQAAQAEGPGVTSGSSSSNSESGSGSDSAPPPSFKTVKRRVVAQIAGRKSAVAQRAFAVKRGLGKTTAVQAFNFAQRSPQTCQSAFTQRLTLAIASSHLQDRLPHKVSCSYASSCTRSSMPTSCPAYTMPASSLRGSGESSCIASRNTAHGQNCR
jgi:hypothetical protein